MEIKKKKKQIVFLESYHEVYHKESHGILVSWVKGLLYSTNRLYSFTHLLSEKMGAQRTNKEFNDIDKESNSINTRFSSLVSPLKAF